MKKRNIFKFFVSSFLALACVSSFVSAGETMKESKAEDENAGVWKLVGVGDEKQGTKVGEETVWTVQTGGGVDTFNSSRSTGGLVDTFEFDVQYAAYADSNANYFGVTIEDTTTKQVVGALVRPSGQTLTVVNANWDPLVDGTWVTAFGTDSWNHYKMQITSTDVVISFNDTTVCTLPKQGGSTFEDFTIKFTTWGVSRNFKNFSYSLSGVKSDIDLYYVQAAVDNGAYTITNEGVVFSGTYISNMGGRNNAIEFKIRFDYMLDANSFSGISFGWGEQNLALLLYNYGRFLFTKNIYVGPTVVDVGEGFEVCDANHFYIIKIVFNGANYSLYVDGVCAYNGVEVAPFDSISGMNFVGMSSIMTVKDMMTYHEHVIADVAEVAPTCTEKGMKAHRECSICKACFNDKDEPISKESLEIAASGNNHSFGEDYVGDATGHYKVCSSCSAHSDVEPHVGKTGTDADWIVTKEATESEEGSKHRVCKICNYDEVVTIPRTRINNGLPYDGLAMGVTGSKNEDPNNPTNYYLPYSGAGDAIPFSTSSNGRFDTIEYDIEYAAFDGGNNYTGITLSDISSGAYTGLLVRPSGETLICGDANWASLTNGAWVSAFEAGHVGHFKVAVGASAVELYFDGVLVATIEKTFTDFNMELRSWGVSRFVRNMKFYKNGSEVDITAKDGAFLPADVKARVENNEVIYTVDDRGRAGENVLGYVNVSYDKLNTVSFDLRFKNVEAVNGFVGLIFNVGDWQNTSAFYQWGRFMTVDNPYVGTPYYLVDDAYEAISPDEFVTIKIVFGKNSYSTYLNGVLLRTEKTDVELSNVRLFRYIGHITEFEVKNLQASHTHNIVEVSEVSATCTDKGIAAHKECSYCGEIYDLNGKPTTLEALEIPSLDGVHEYEEEWSFDNDHHYRVCKHCGGKEELIPHVGKTGTDADWVITKEATRDEEGSKYRICEVCGAKEVVTIAKLPELYDLGTNWKRTTENGEDVYTASGNGGAYGFTVIADADINTVEAAVRHNTAVVDRNVGIHLISHGADYFFDYRQDVNAFRFRIGESWIDTTYVQAFELDEWFVMKMTISEGNVHCYINGKLVYNIDNPDIFIAENKATFTISTWETKSSVKNIAYSKVEREIVGIEIEVPDKTNYKFGEDLDLTGFKVTKIYSIGASEEASATEFTLSTFDANKIGKQTITVTVGSFTASFDVNVSDSVVSISIVPPTKLSYKYGEFLDFDGLVVNVTYASGATAVATPLEYDVGGYDETVIGTQTVTISVEGKSATFDVTVSNYATELKVTLPSKVAYKYGEDLDLTGLVVTKVMADGSEVVATSDEIVVFGYDKNTSGLQTVTLTVSDLTSTFKVNVGAKPAEDPSVEPSVAPDSETPVSETPATSEENKGGCGGSIAATCGIIALLSTLGVAVISLKKKEN